LEYVVGSCPPKFKHLFIKLQGKDPNASCVVENKLCCSFVCKK
jgi:hypothetical protein